MLIVTGINNRLIANSMTDALCPNCNSTGKFRMNVYQKYATFFYIPFMPAGKEVVAVCESCGASYKKKDFTSSLKQSYTAIKKTAASWWMYSGLSVCVALMGFAVYMGVLSERENERMANNPAEGNIYDVKLEDKVFTLLKVTAVKGDSVYIVQNQFSADNYTGFDGMRDKPYSTYAHGVHKNQIKEWYDNGIIRNVHAE